MFVEAEMQVGNCVNYSLEFKINQETEAKVYQNSVVRTNKK